MKCDELARRLGESAKPSGGGKWMARCPSHDDARRSLSFQDGGKALLIHCFAGCAAEQVVEALGLQMADLFHRPEVEPPGRTRKKGDRPPGVVAAYDYRDESGKLLSQVLRFANKQFKQRRPDPRQPDGWLWNMADVRRVPYRLPELLGADPTEMFYVVEGERDVETMGGAGFVATTSQGGAASSRVWRTPAFRDAVRGRHVTIIPDNDEPGRAYARDVATALKGVAKSVRTLHLPGLSEKGDVSDWFAGGGTRAELERLTKTCEFESAESGSPGRGDRVEDQGEKQNLTQRIVDLAGKAMDLFKTAEDEAFASIRRNDHQETRPVDSKQFRQLLIEMVYREEGRFASSNAINEAAAALEALAVMGDKVVRVDLRVSTYESVCYLDLGSPTWEVVEMSSAGWRVVAAADVPVRFRRPRAMLPLPEPVRGGHIDELRPFLNPGRDENWRLMLAWLTFGFHSEGPFPVLVVQGEQGSAKSTISKILRALIDPSASELRIVPKDMQDLMVGAQNSRVLAFDNLSGLPPWLSDGLCILSTGGAYVSRALFTGSEETILRASRPVIINGIDSLTSRPDLADRAVMVSLPTIAPERRRDEAEFWTTFNAAKPRILGALCSAMAAGLRARPSVCLASRPRMADFAAWGVALERGLGWPPGSFLEAYQGNLTESATAALEADSVAMAVLALVGNVGPWEGTVFDFLGALEQQMAPERRGRDWPRSPQALTNRMKRVVPALRREGIEASQPPRTKHGASWVVRRMDQPPESSSPSSVFAKPRPSSGLAGDDVHERQPRRGDEPPSPVTNGDDVTARQAEFVTFSGPRLPWSGVEGDQDGEHCFFSRSREGGSGPGRNFEPLRAEPDGVATDEGVP